MAKIRYYNVRFTTEEQLEIFKKVIALSEDIEIENVEDDVIFDDYDESYCRVWNARVKLTGFGYLQESIIKGFELKEA
jgi:hypothetical protein